MYTNHKMIFYNVKKMRFLGLFFVLWMIPDIDCLLCYQETIHLKICRLKDKLKKYRGRVRREGRSLIYTLICGSFTHIIFIIVWFSWLMRICELLLDYNLLRGVIINFLRKCNGILKYSDWSHHGTALLWVLIYRINDVCHERWWYTWVVCTPE